MNAYREPADMPEEEPKKVGVEPLITDLVHSEALFWEQVFMHWIKSGSTINASSNAADYAAMRRRARTSPPASPLPGTGDKP